MNGWIEKPLSEIADITMGQSPDSKYYTEEEEGMPFTQGCAEFSSRYPKPKINCTQIKKVAKAGSILFSVRAPVGRINVADRDYVIGRGLASILATDIVPGLLEQYLVFCEPQFRAVSQGSTFEAINSKELSGWPIQFPADPVEQREMAGLLEELDRAIEQTEAFIAKQQRIKTGLMQDLLTKGIDERGNIRSESTHAFKDSPLGRIPVEWGVEKLGDIVDVIDPNPSHRYPLPTDIGVPITSTENFSGDDAYDLSRAEHVPFDVYESQNARCSFAKDDVIFARKGRIGLARPYGTEPKVFSHTVVLLKPRLDSMQAKFILWTVRFRGFFNEIDKRMNSNSGVPTLGVGFIQAIPIAVPPRQERQHLVATLDENERVCGLEVRKLEKLNLTKVGLMNDLLTGKVRVTELLKQPAT
jgi:type I restriction enzyme, S subunit